MSSFFGDLVSRLIFMMINSYVCVWRPDGQRTCLEVIMRFERIMSGAGRAL